MSNVMAALRNIGGALCSTPQSLADAHYSTCPYNMVNFDPLAAETASLVWGTPGNFNGFASWQRYCTAL